MSWLTLSLGAVVLAINVASSTGDPTLPIGPTMDPAYACGPRSVAVVCAIFDRTALDSELSEFCARDGTATFEQLSDALEQQGLRCELFETTPSRLSGTPGVWILELTSRPVNSAYYGQSAHFLVAVSNGRSREVQVIDATLSLYEQEQLHFSDIVKLWTGIALRIEDTDTVSESGVGYVEVLGGTGVLLAAALGLSVGRAASSRVRHLLAWPLRT